MDEYQIQLQGQIAEVDAEMGALQKRLASLKERASALRSALALYRKSARQAKPSREKNQREIVLDLLEKSWPEGLTLQELMRGAKNSGYELNENTVMSHLSRAAKAGQVQKRHLRRFVRPPGGFNLDGPKG